MADSQFVEIGKYLQIKRKELNKSQQEIADEIGVSQRSYSMYEEGIRKPKYETMIALQKALGIKDLSSLYYPNSVLSNITDEAQESKTKMHSAVVGAENKKPGTETEPGYSKEYVELLKEQLEFLKGLVKSNSEQTGQRLELIHQQTSSILAVLTGAGQNSVSNIPREPFSESDTDTLKEVQKEISGRGIGVKKGK